MIQVFNKYRDFLFYHLKKKSQRTSYKRYYLPIVEIKYYNVMTDGQNFFDQIVRHKLITYDGIKKLQQVNETITQLVVCFTLMISKTTLK